MWYRITTTMAIVAIVLPLPLTSGAFGCPPKCKCTDGSVACVDKILSGIPDFRKTTTEPLTIDLSGNDIEEVKATNFFGKRLEKLHTLLLNDNSIFTIEANAFAYLPNLQYLDLSNNLLDSIPAEVVLKNKQLVDLNLSGNLFVSKTPQIDSTSLQVLDLSFCKISTFAEENLKGLPSLRALYLNANSLQHVDYSIFVNTNLKYVDLSYNSWKCSCDTIKLFDYLVKAELTQIQTPIQCMHRNKWYQDIYDSNGPLHQNKLCKKEHHHIDSDAHQKNTVHVQKAENETKAEVDNFVFTMEAEILIVAGVVAVLVVISLISLAVVVRRNKVSHKHVYDDLRNVSIDSRFSDGSDFQK